MATSGDTGKAALEGFRDVPGTRIIVFFPDAGVSEIQKPKWLRKKGEMFMLLVFTAILIMPRQV